MQRRFCSILAAAPRLCWSANAAAPPVPVSFAFGALPCSVSVTQIVARSSADSPETPTYANLCAFASPFGYCFLNLALFPVFQPTKIIFGCYFFTYIGVVYQKYELSGKRFNLGHRVDVSVFQAIFGRASGGLLLHPLFQQLHVIH
jgi:hypothetical protein